MTQAQFLHRLKRVAATMEHSELATRLGIKRSLLRNWMYRNLPPDLAVKALSTKLEELANHK